MKKGGLGKNILKHLIKDLYQNIYRKLTTRIDVKEPDTKWAKEINRYFTKEDI